MKKDSVTISEYKEYGKYHNTTIIKRLGWRNACLSAGLKLEENQNRTYIESQELIEDLKRVACDLNLKTVTKAAYDEYGKYNGSILIKRFDGWNNALKLAGLEITLNRNFTKEELLEDIERVWIILGRQPTATDIKNGASKFSLQSYSRRFNEWRGALEAFTEFINSEEDITLEDGVISCLENEFFDQTIVDETDSVIKHKTKRDINYRLRFKVMQRDNFRCCACGASPAKNPEVELHVDHIMPWAKGGETTFENLQTLCSVCNWGKSDLILE